MGKQELIYLVKPWAHQLEGIERARVRREFALFYEMGAGKTLTACNILRHWCVKAGRPLRTLVLGPPIVIQNWRREINMHSKMGNLVRCVEGTGKQRADILREDLLAEFDIGNRRPGIVVTNYETLLMEKALAHLVDWKPEVIIFDESHKCKSLKAKRTKLATKLADLAEYKLILTGTPILNTPMDLFAQYRILDGGVTFGKNFFVFRATYFYDKNAGMPQAKHFPDWRLKAGALESLNAAIKDSSMVVKKADCMDLPPLLRQVVKVPLSFAQAKLYKAMKDDFVAYMGSSACVATLAITKALRLQQIVSGFLTVTDEGEDPRNVSIKDNPRAEALKELLSDITPGAKCLVWCVFRENYATVRTICESLGVGYVEVHGAVSAAARQVAVDKFNTEENIRVFIGHPGSAGIGINLVSASYSIFYSRNFSLENDLQAEARNHRGGSEIHEKITRIDLVAEDTIDERIGEALAGKFEIGERVLRSIAEEMR